MGLARTLWQAGILPVQQPRHLGLALRHWRRGALLVREFASLRLSPLTSGLALRRWRSGAPLDGEFASLRRFGFGPEAVAEGRAAGR